MIGKKINQLATELAPVSTDLTIIGDPISGVSKKITLAQLGAIFSGAVSFYTDLASFPATGDINVIYCAKDTQKLYLWSGSAYTEIFPSQALLDTYQLRSEKGNANGYASLDSQGKVPISQLPSSIMEYKGMWNAATNTPTLANGTGDTGDVYICNVAGTVNFGAGPITFAVGDYVIYSGTIWQRSSGAVGTVTSVAASITGDAISVSGSPVTTSGTLALAFSGTSSQYINGAGNLINFPSLTGYVPYTGATTNVNLGEFGITSGYYGFDLTPTNTPTTQGTMYWNADKESVDIIMNGVTGSVMQDSFYNVKNQTGSSIPKGTVVMASGTVGASGRILIAPFLADGTYDSKLCIGVTSEAIADGADGKVTAFGAIRQIDTSAFANGTILYASPSVAGAFTSTEPTNPNNIITLAIVVYSDTNNGEIFVRPTFVDNAADIAAALGYTPQAQLNGTGFVKASGTTISYDNSTYLTTSAAATTYLPMVLSSTANSIEINGQFFDVASAANSYTSGRLIIAPTYGAIGYQNAGVFDGLKILTNGNAEFSNSGVTRFFNQVRFDSTLTNGTYTYTLPGATGTIALTSDLTGGTVTSVGLSSATSGVTIGSTPITTSGTITLAIATASGSQQGLLSSTDWTTFNNKQNALTNPVTGTGTTNYLPKFTGASTIGNSAVSDDGSTVTLNSRALSVSGGSTLTGRVTSVEIGVTKNGADTIGDGPWFRWTNAAQDRQMLTQLNASNGLTTWAFNGTSWSSLLTLTQSGNLGLGVTPSAWSEGKAIELSSASIWALSTTDVNYLANTYFNGSFRYVNNHRALRYYQDSDLGIHAWYIAPSGTAGNAISFTQAMTLDASGRLGIGTTSPSEKLDVIGGAVAAGNGTIRTGITYSSLGLIGTFTNHDLGIITNGSERMRIIANGNVGIGTTSPNYTGYGSGITVLSLATSTSDKFSAIELVGNRGIGGNQNGSIAFINNNGTATVTSRITGINTSGSVLGGEITFETKPDAGSLSERMRITSGGNVVIGGTTAGTSLNTSLTVNNASAGNYSGFIPMTADTQRGYYGGTSTGLEIGVAGSGILGIWTGGSERMRITSGGTIAMNQSTTYGAETLEITGLISGGAQYGILMSGNPASYTNYAMRFHYTGVAVVGSITFNTTSTAYNTSSDYRLKQDLKDFNGLDLVSKLKAYDYEWKADKTRSYGVIAHELQSVINYAVTGVKDGKEMQGVDYSKIVPVLIKAIQELNDKIK